MEIIFALFYFFSSFSLPEIQEEPAEIVGIYLTAWSISSREEQILKMVRETEINALVIDVKDYSGRIFFPFKEDYGASYPLLSTSLMERLKDKELYLVARLTAFQDPVLARARPDLALKNLKGELWRDNLGLQWVDPAAKEAWEYYARIAREAEEFGFDEINFDYIRFPSDGVLAEIVYPFFDGVSRREVMKEFYAYLRESLPQTKISASIFGLTTTAKNDMGIGQRIEDAFLYFDFINPMVYPSHYGPFYLGKESPALYPYDVVFHSLSAAKDRGEKGKIRPWLQDFSIRGVSYGKKEVAAQIQATKDSLGDDFIGYFLWSPRNVYTIDAIK